MKPVCITALLLTAILNGWADDTQVQTIQQSPSSSKQTTGNGQASVNGSVQVPTNTTNLREQPAYNIPFPEQVNRFQDDPAQHVIKIGPMPDSLNPMGPPKPVVKNVATSSSQVDGSKVDLPARKLVDLAEPAEKTPSAGVSTESITASPFLSWIQNTKSAAAIAQQQRDAYQSNTERAKSPQDGSDQDMFLNIRFPYVGNQDAPPSGGAVIYSVPQR